MIGDDDVMFGIVLGLRDRLDRVEAWRENRFRVDTNGPFAIGVASPGEKRASEVVVALPVSALDQRQDASTIGTGLGAEDAIAGLRLGFMAGQVFPGVQFSQIVLAREILIERFVELDDH